LEEKKSVSLVGGKRAIASGWSSENITARTREGRQFEMKRIGGCLSACLYVCLKSERSPSNATERAKKRTEKGWENRAFVKR
jgi:hypothetical protein